MVFKEYEWVVGRWGVECLFFENVEKVDFFGLDGFDDVDDGWIGNVGKKEIVGEWEMGVEVGWVCCYICCGESERGYFVCYFWW